MSQQEFDNFKQRIKDWMDNHPEEYDCFEEEMNLKDNTSYQKILTMAFTLVPRYQKIIQKRANHGSPVKPCVFSNHNFLDLPSKGYQKWQI